MLAIGRTMRVESVDIAKGIGMLLVIFGHTNYMGELDIRIMQYVNVFHMALFFYLSGLFINMSLSFDVFLKRKCFGLMSPYFLWGFFAFIVYIVVTPRFLCDNLEVLPFLLMKRTNGYYFTSTMWFLPALLCSLLITYIIFKYIKKKWIKFLFIIASVAFAFLCSNNSVILPLNADVALYMLPFTYFAKETNMFCYSNNTRLFLISVVLLFAYPQFIKYGVFGMNYKDYMNIYSQQFGFAPFNYVSAISGIFIVCSFSCYLIRFHQLDYVRKCLKYIGKNSLLYMIIHQAFIIHPMNCYNILVNNSCFNGMIRYISIISITTICILIINYLIPIIKYRH